MINIEERLDAYLSGLTVGDDTKRKIRHDVKEFMSVLKERGRTWPGAEDYEGYQQKLRTAGISDGTIKDATSRVRKFFDSLTDEKGPECDFSEAHEVTAQQTQEPVISEVVDRPDEMKESGSETKTRRFSLLIQPTMYEALEWLSQYDRCSVAKVILNACSEYTTQRREDIEYITEQMNILKRGIEQREAGKG